MAGVGRGKQAIADDAIEDGCRHSCSARYAGGRCLEPLDEEIEWPQCINADQDRTLRCLTVQLGRYGKLGA